jgi:uncharacterized protein (DUF433 family)
MAFQKVEFTPCEAAYIADLSHREVQKAFDEGWFDRTPGHSRGGGMARRHLGPAEVTHLRAVKDVAGLAILTNEAKKLVHRQLLACMPLIMIAVSRPTAAGATYRQAADWIAQGRCYAIDPSAHVCLSIQVKEKAIPSKTKLTPYKWTKQVAYKCCIADEHQHNWGELYFSHQDQDHVWGEFRSCLSAVDEKLKEPFRIASNLFLDLSSSWRQIGDRLAKAMVAQHIVVSDPEIRGGEPVVRGTRIPAYLLHDLVEQGATKEELLADYPAIDADRLSLALLYTKTHPRPGRPRKRPRGSPVGAS